MGILGWALFYHNPVTVMNYSSVSLVIFLAVNSNLFSFMVHLVS